MNEYWFGIVVGISKGTADPIEIPLSDNHEGRSEVEALQVLFPTAQLRRLSDDGCWLVYLQNLPPVGHFATSQLVVRVHKV